MGCENSLHIILERNCCRKKEFNQKDLYIVIEYGFFFFFFGQ